MALFGRGQQFGPGVSKNEPQKTAFFRFFELYFRKFGNLIKLNLLYFFSIIWFFVPAGIVVLGHGLGWNVLFAASLLFIAGAGPATAGFVYIIRNYTREEPTFLWMDYIDTIKTNWKQSLLSAFMNVFGMIVLVFAVHTYDVFLKHYMILVLPMALTVIFLLVFFFMQFYIFVMIVTFDLKLKEIYRNAFIFAIINFFRNIGITILLAIALFVLVGIIFPITLITVPFLTLSTAAMIIVFAVWPVIQKYLIRDEEEKETAEGEDEDSIFHDNGKEH